MDAINEPHDERLARVQGGDPDSRRHGVDNLLGPASERQLKEVTGEVHVWAFKRWPDQDYGVSDAFVVPEVERLVDAANVVDGDVFRQDLQTKNSI